ncbi:ferritin-like domain-containing protein [Streptomyces sp. NPDC093085]|uniref:ferritin-like domain-containing protein n=1 Tax=Streptomyces sp. NPDC093085 TaxID=3155068 RepID=UPI0034135F23
MTTSEAPRDAGRRRFLRIAGGTGAVWALAACSAGGRGAAPAAYGGELRALALAAALENQAAGVYRAALTAARAGRLGTVPAETQAFLTTAAAHHTAHAEEWNAALRRAGKPPVTGVPLTDHAEVTAALERARSASETAALALRLEERAARTHLLAACGARGAPGIATAAAIAPAEAAHAATLRLLLGQDPVPDAFLRVEGAARAALLTV